MSTAMSSRLRRIAKELQNCQDTGVNVRTCNEDDLTHLEASLSIPPNTPYFGGTYTISIVIPDDYPFAKQSIKFNQKKYYPNVHLETGAGTDDTRGSLHQVLLAHGKPTNTIKSTLQTIVKLLQQPDSDFPVNKEANTLFLRINSVFRERAQECAVKYAGAPATETDSASYGGYNRSLIEPFIDMGYDKDAVDKAFQYVGIDRNNDEDYILEEAYQGDILAGLSDA